MPQGSFNPPWFVRKDLDGFFGLMIDNLIQLILIVSLCRELIHLPNRIIETGGSEHPLLAVGTFFLAIAGLVLMRLIVRLIGSLWIRRDNPRISPSESH